jgi:hypothetical protein
MIQEGTQLLWFVGHSLLRPAGAVMLALCLQDCMTELVDECLDRFEPAKRRVARRSAS